MRKLSKLFYLGSIGIVIVFVAALFISLQLINQSKETKLNPSTQKEKLIIGFSQIGTESAWRIQNTKSIFEAAKDRDIEILYDDAKQKQSNQLKAIRSFIVYQVDVIVFVPIVSDGWDNVLQEAKDANIPVIVIDRQINADPSLYAGFLGEDGFEQGKSAAKFLINKCNNSTKEKFNILELAGTANSSIAVSRAEGFREIIEKDARFNFIHSEDGDFLRSRGKEIMDKIIAKSGGLKIGNEPIHVIFSHNDPMTLGLLESLDEHKISTKNTIIISIDAEQESIDALKEGKLNCVVECNPNLGPTLMDLVQKIAAGETIPRTTYMNETVFTENDDFSTYVPRGY